MQTFIEYAGRIVAAIESAESEGYTLRDESGLLDPGLIEDSISLLCWAFEPNRIVCEATWNAVKKAFYTSLAAARTEACCDVLYRPHEGP